MTEVIKKLKARRGVIKGQLSRIKSLLTDEKIKSMNSFELETKLGLLENYFNNFNGIQFQLEEIDASGPTERDEFEDSYSELKSKILTSINGNFDRQSAANTTFFGGSSNTHSDLPKHKLKVFSGEPDKWLDWWSMYSIMVEEKVADPRDKFQRLRNLLEGNAYECIRSLEPTAENYPEALRILRNQYDNKRYLYRIHIGNIIDLKNIPFASVNHLVSINNTINSNMRALLSLSTKEQVADGLLLALVTSKLDSFTASLWEEHVTKLDESMVKDQANSNTETVKGKAYLPTWEDFSNFVQKRCRTLELIEFNKKQHSSHKQQDKGLKPIRYQQRPHSFQVTQSTNCPFCTQNCQSAKTCSNFTSKSQNDRYNLVKSLNLCLNCLKPGHGARNCQSSKCRNCQGSHHTLLHRDQNSLKYSPSSSGINHKPNRTFFSSEEPISSTNSAQESPSSSLSENAQQALHTVDDEPTIKTISDISKSQVILSTALIEVKSSNNKFITCRALLDSGSQLNFITNRLIQLLGLKRLFSNTNINGIGSSGINSNYKSLVTLKSRINEFSTAIEAIIFENITGNIPVNRFDIHQLQIPNNVPLADPSFNVPQRIDLLIGAGIFYNLLSVGQIRLGQQSTAVLQKTLFGWIISGEIKTETNNCLLSTQNRFQSESDSALNQLVSRFWELDSCQNNQTFSPEEEACDKYYTDTYSRLRNGRFVVRLPYRKTPNSIGESHQIALKRFFNLERRLNKDSQLKHAYTEFIQEYINLGHMKRISNSELGSPNYFLPHHPVIKPESSSTKVRVVFDGSCRTSNGISLNDLLMNGPKLQDDIFEILIRFRLFKYAITADIVKMYRQIYLNENDQNMQCILWRNDNNQPVEIYRLNTVTYGTTSASYLAIKSMVTLAQENKLHNAIGAHHVLNNFYVDNLMTGADTIEELHTIKNEVTKLLLKGAFPLKKWCSNAEEVLADIDPSDKETLLKIDNDEVIRVLGLLWNPSIDNFSFSSFNSTITSTNLTKRIILSQVASLFDPLGFINPVVVNAKLFLRHLWTKGFDWDESLPQDLHYQWKGFYQQIRDLQKLRIPRLVLIPGAKIQLHGFSDASMRAYGACIYFRSLCSDGTVNTQLVCAKSKVAPILCESLARLELCGALLLAELIQRVKLAINIDIESTFCWTDSTIALSWITPTANQWSIFVSNRISKIQQLTNCESWNHVPSKFNPADIISRGCLPEELLKNKLWFNGPQFLELERDFWPHLEIRISNDCPEQKRQNFVFLANNNNHEVTDLTLNCKFLNSYFRLILVFCYVRRWRSKAIDRSKVISSREINEAEKAVIWNIQMVYFKKEIKVLSQGREITESNMLRLGLFLDDQGILRVGGRLRNSPFNYNSKHQLILPPLHPLTNSLIMHYHLNYFHAGTQTVLHIIRRKFWIVDGLRKVGKVLRSCLTCFRFNPKLSNQLMGDLPADRITPARPFSTTGIDFCGPVYLTQRIRGRPPIKGYICVFVCFVIKAVHLELVPDLSTEAFLAALRRFVARRGNCLKLYSDNGTNFTGAKNELEKIGRSLGSAINSEEVQQFCQGRRIEWHFIPPRAPHFGGLWEAAVRVAKRLMQKTFSTVGNRSFTYDEMTTLLCQIEAVMNSRPLSRMSNDPQDMEVLTPAHFLVGGPLTDLPQPQLHSNFDRLSHYHQIQHMRDLFWKQWKREYLHILQTRNIWKSKTQNIKIDDIVLMYEDNTPPLRWPVGRVVDVHPGPDGRVRVVSVLTKGTVYRRPIQKVALIPKQ